MAGPSQQQALTFIVPPGEAQVQYSASSLAYKVQNLELTPEGTLQSITGPTPYEPLRNRAPSTATSVGDTANSLGTTDTPHSIFHASILAGQVGLLVARVGTQLYRHAGWDRGWELIDTGLSSESRPQYPDQFVVLNDKIIWTNGVDQARLIGYDGTSALLGFTQIPSAPVGLGPTGKRDYQKGDEQYYPNAHGYSWGGRIGTPGNVLDGIEGSILAGTWYYYVQLEDSWGNLSATSPPSNPVNLETIQANPYDPVKGYDGDAEKWIVYDATIDDLTRQFIVQTGGSAPDHCTAIHLYRTSDTRNVDTTPRFLTRIANNRQAMYPDNKSDTDLGAPMVEMVPTPVFRHLCTHQGRLVIANTVGSPGIVRRSQVGFPGTFETLEYVYPDSGGAEVTAVTSHNGVLLAFTETSVYSLEEFGAPRPLAQGVGCVAPRSIKALSNGTLIWLGRDGFYGFTPKGIVRLSSPIDRTVRYYLNRGRLRMSVATIDAESGEYRCAVPPAGVQKNSLVLCFDGQSWRRLSIGIAIMDWCQVDDWRQYVLALGQEMDSSDVGSGGRNGSDRVEVYVMSRETQSYTPPNREVIYRSGWIRGDAVGLMPTHIRTMYIGMVDAWNGDFKVNFYRNGSWDSVYSMSDVKAIGVDDESRIVTDIAGAAVIGTAKAHDPRLYWRQVPVGLENASSWAFEIVADSPARLHIAAFAFDVSAATGGNVRGRIPFRADE
jgi:hypothetical protein